MGILQLCHARVETQGLRKLNLNSRQNRRRYYQDGYRNFIFFVCLLIVAGHSVLAQTAFRGAAGAGSRAPVERPPGGFNLTDL